jgi:hypothetical protein
MWVPGPNSTSYPGQYLRCPQASKNFNNPNFNPACKNFKENYAPYNGQAPAPAYAPAPTPQFPPYPGSNGGAVASVPAPAPITADYSAYSAHSVPAPAPPRVECPVDSGRFLVLLQALDAKIDGLAGKIDTLNAFLGERMMIDKE